MPQLNARFLADRAFRLNRSIGTGEVADAQLNYVLSDVVRSGDVRFFYGIAVCLLHTLRA